MREGGGPDAYRAIVTKGNDSFLVGAREGEEEKGAERAGLFSP